MSDATHDAHGEHDDGAVHAHVSSWQFLAGIFACLVILTIITVAVSYVDLGSANTIVAVLIATMKASLVAVFFMHLRHDKPFNSVVFVMAFVFLGVFLILTLDDLTTRGQVTDDNGVAVLPRTGAYAPGTYEADQGTPLPGTPAAATPRAHFIPRADDSSHTLPHVATHVEGEPEHPAAGAHEGGEAH